MNRGPCGPADARRHFPDTQRAVIERVAGIALI